MCSPHKCCCEVGHLVNSHPSPHLTMSFSDKIPDKLISRHNPVIQQDQEESHFWLPQKSNPSCSVWLEGWIMLVVNSPFGLAVLHPDIAVAGISPSRLFSNISQTKPTLTPVFVSHQILSYCYMPYAILLYMLYAILLYMLCAILLMAVFEYFADKVNFDTNLSIFVRHRILSWPRFLI